MPEIDRMVPRDWEKLSTNTREALINAAKAAKATGSEKVEPKHLLFGMAASQGSVASSILSELGISSELMNQGIEETEPANGTIESILSDESKAIFLRALNVSRDFRVHRIGSAELLTAFLDYTRTMTEYREIGEIETNSPFAPIILRKSP